MSSECLVLVSYAVVGGSWQRSGCASNLRLCFALSLLWCRLLPALLCATPLLCNMPAAPISAIQTLFILDPMWCSFFILIGSFHGVFNICTTLMDWFYFCLFNILLIFDTNTLALLTKVISFWDVSWTIFGWAAAWNILGLDEHGCTPSLRLLEQGTARASGRTVDEAGRTFENWEQHRTPQPHPHWPAPSSPQTMQITLRKRTTPTIVSLL